MSNHLARRKRALSAESGFTLIELLVVILIIGILAAVAIPSFLNQRLKGQDACAKSMTKQIQTAIETYKTENNSYAGATIASMNAIEASITGNSCAPGAWVLVGAYDGSATGCGPGAPNGTSYCVGAASGSGSNFFIKNSGTTITRTCATQAGSPTPHGGCLGTGGNGGSW